MGIFVSILLLLIVGVLYLVPGEFSDDKYLIESTFVIDGPCQITVDGKRVTDDRYVSEVINLWEGYIYLECSRPLENTPRYTYPVSGGFTMPRFPASSSGELIVSERRLEGGILNVPFVQQAPDKHTRIMLVVKDARYRSISERDSDGTFSRTLFISGSAVRKYAPP